MLTIFIPTFNRVNDLARLLDLLIHQIDADDNYSVFFRIHVSDNASTDGTRYYLSGINKKYLSFDTLPSNIGADLNIKRSAMVCNTRYLWIHGDDDYPCGDMIKSIYEHLLVVSSNLIYMPAKWLKCPSVSVANASHSGKCTNVEVLDFIKSANVKITFITSFIINLDFYKSQMQNGDRAVFKYSNFEHLELILPAVRNKLKLFAFHNTCIFASGNSKFSYSVIDAFGVDLPRLLGEALPNDRKIVRLIVNRLIVCYLPAFIYGAKTGLLSGAINVNWRGLHIELRSYFLYWIFVYPLRFFPPTLSLCWVVLSRVFR